MSKPKPFKFLAKTFEFLNRFVPIIENKSTGQLLYGIDDLLPNNNLRMINDCGVAKRCVRKKARYIQGDGFSNEDSAKLQVNPKQTADQLLQHISSYAAYNEGFALEIKRNLGGQIIEVKSIPFECVRKMTDGNFTYNPKKGQCDANGWNNALDIKDTTYHAAFFGLNPTPDQKRLLAQPKIDGKENKFYKNSEIFYVYEQTADNPNYPVPDYNAGLEDIQTCIEISKMDLELCLNGFMGSMIFTTAEIDNVNKDDAGKTPYDYFEEQFKKFTGRVKDAVTGLAGRFKALHMMVSNPSEAPKTEFPDMRPVLEGTNTKRDIIAREVCRLIGVHPILALFSDAAVLGNTQALANAITDLNNYINPIQRMISQAFKTLYPDKEWMISQHNPITYIPAEVWSKMTDDEIRNVVGLEPLEKKVTTEAENTLNALNSISPLVANKVLESLSEEEIRALIGLKAKVVPSNGTVKPITTDAPDNQN